MGNCQAWIHKQREPSRELTLAILGLDNAGKTVTTKGLQGESLDTVAPTVGFSSVDFKFEKHAITLFDLGGGKRIRDIWTNYFAEVYGLIYVVDSSEPERLSECKDVLKNLLQHTQIAGKPVLVLGNKQDVQGALDEIDICEHLELEETVNMNKCPCRVETCSAIMGQGKKLDPSIKQGFSWLINIIISNFEKLNLRVQKDVEEMKEQAEREKRERKERVRKQKEERERLRKERGEPGSDEEEAGEDIVDGGDPFKKLSLQELQEKEKKEKAKKKAKSPDDSVEDQETSLPMKLSALPPIGLSQSVSKSEDFDSRNLSRTTPRPMHAAASLDLATSGYGLNKSTDLLLEKGFGRRGAGGLAPLTPLAPVDQLDTGEKKRRKKKKPKRNQTSPSNEEDGEGSSTHNGLDLHTGPRSLSPTYTEHSRNLLRASKSPRLETLEEPENGEEGGTYSSALSKFGVEDGLPELAPEVISKRGTLPNSDYDSVLT